MTSKKIKNVLSEPSLRNSINELVGEKLAAERKKLGLSQEDISNLISDSYGSTEKLRTIQRWEAGKTPSPASMLANLVILHAQAMDADSKAAKREAILEGVAASGPQTVEEALAKVRAWLDRVL